MRAGRRPVGPKPDASGGRNRQAKRRESQGAAESRDYANSPGAKKPWVTVRESRSVRAVYLDNMRCHAADVCAAGAVLVFCPAI